MQGREHHYPTQLSGGQQQRVAIARALVSGPLIAVGRRADRKSRYGSSREIMAILDRLNKEQGITVILVTHEPDIAAYASREIVIKDGRSRPIVGRKSDAALGPLKPNDRVYPSHRSYRDPDSRPQPAASRSDHAGYCHRCWRGDRHGQHRRGRQGGRLPARRQHGHERHHCVARARPPPAGSVAGKGAP